MSELPLVSALVATYNYDRFLARTLDSALTQDYPADRLEIIVVDDGSTDETPAILADYTARYPGRVRAIRQQNAGASAAAGRALAEARGDFLALLDADDVWPVNKTREQVEIFLARPEVGAVYSDMEIIDAEDNVIAPSYWDVEGKEATTGASAYEPLIWGGNPALASSIMLRGSLREVFTPMPSTLIYGDWWLVAQVAQVAELAVSDGIRVGYRNHGANLTLAISDPVALTRERVRPTLTRRSTLARGGVALLPVEHLAKIWALIEWDALKTVKKFKSAFVEFPQPSDDERTASAVHARRAVRLVRRGRYEQALRTYLQAAVENPYNQEARLRVKSLGERLTGLEPKKDPLGPARGYAVLGDIAELEREPELLTAFAAAFSNEDDVTLYVHAPGFQTEELKRRFGALLVGTGVDPNAGPDIVVQLDRDGLLDFTELQAVADETLSTDTVRGLRDRYELAMLPLIPLARRIRSLSTVA